MQRLQSEKTRQQAQESYEKMLWPIGGAKVPGALCRAWRLRRPKLVLALSLSGSYNDLEFMFFVVA